MDRRVERDAMTVRPLGLGLLGAAVAAGSPPAATPIDPPPKGYVCHRATGPITIDGDLNEPAWTAVPWSDPFVDIEGDKKPAPRFRTRMKMLWDAEALYIAAELEEPHVWADLTDHDAVVFHDPDFEVFLDPDADSHLYAELELNARNTTWDLLLPKPYKDGGRAINGWEVIGLKTAVKVNGTLNDPTDTDRGWTVEIRWPFAGVNELTAVPVPPRDGDQWRINFSRVEWDITTDGGKYQKVKGRPEHNWVWSPQGVIDMHRPERWGYLQFSAAAPGTVPFKPDPTADARDTLHRLYYAQRHHQAKHGRYAGSLEALGLPGLGAKIETTTGGFEASLPAGDRRVTITHDAQVTVK
jgi:hypothetical protein